MRKLLILSIVVLLTGCTSAGPYVTNIASDGKNGLNIEKCMVRYYSIIGILSTGECTVQNIKIISED